jgi:hypothetical protein
MSKYRQCKDRQSHTGGGDGDHDRTVEQSGKRAHGGHSEAVLDEFEKSDFFRQIDKVYVLNLSTTHFMLIIHYSANKDVSFIRDQERNNTTVISDSEIEDIEPPAKLLKSSVSKATIPRHSTSIQGLSDVTSGILEHFNTKALNFQKIEQAKLKQQREEASKRFELERERLQIEERVIQAKERELKLKEREQALTMCRSSDPELVRMGKAILEKL